MRPLAPAPLVLQLRAVPAFVRVALFTLLVLAAAGLAQAEEIYRAYARGVYATGKEPPQTLEGEIASSYNSTLSWHVTADRGIWRSRSRIENDYECLCTPQIFPGPDFANTDLMWLTITGPEGQPAHGTVHFRLEGILESTGQDPWNANVKVQISPGGHLNSGALYLTGSALTSEGLLAGQSGPIVDRAIDLDFDIEQPDIWPLRVRLQTEVGGTSFGSGHNMGAANFYDDRNGDGLGGLHFRTDGPAFTLPAGFFVNSPYFGIVDNWWVGQSVGVPARSPDEPRLALALPENPVRASTRVSYVLPRAGAARLEALDLQGRVVAVLDDGWREAGPHSVIWSAAGALPGGLYFLRVSFAGASAVRKVTVLR